jgi:chemotaxis protein methyltransferase CheR
MTYSKQQLERVRQLAYKHAGITLGHTKDAMISNRLDKLKDALNSNDIDDILNRLASNKHVDTFVTAITTNKTEFFREGYHFDDLIERVIPAYETFAEPMRLYCAAASTGEEPYTILMTMEHAKKIYGLSKLKYSLLASDIDKEALQKSKNGIYEWQKSSEGFPAWINPANYFQRRPMEDKPGDYWIRIKDALRANVEFGKMNLMNHSYPFRDGQFDVVFCRNVLIYFSQDDQNEILKKLFRTLKVGGTLYLGHSESPLKLAAHVEYMGHNIFVKRSDFR